MKRITVFLLSAAIILCVMGVMCLMVYGIICLTGWKFALAMAIVGIVLFLWIGDDIHNCAVEDENGNMVIPEKEKEQKKEASEPLDRI